MVKVDRDIIRKVIDYGVSCEVGLVEYVSRYIEALVSEDRQRMAAMHQGAVKRSPLVQDPERFIIFRFAKKRGESNEGKPAEDPRPGHD